MNNSPPAPTNDAARIVALDTLRGFALLGIPLLNIIGFGLHGAAYFNPVVDGATSGLNFYTWAGVDIAFEGSMRTLFSMLFGAGVVLFTTGDAAKSALIHYRRNFWLLVFGLVNVTLLLWDGDILVTYAISGALLYLVRNKSPRWLLMTAGFLLLLLSLQYLVMQYGLGALRAQAISEGTTQAGAGLSAEASEWLQFKNDFAPTADKIAADLAARSAGYASNWQFTNAKLGELYGVQLPLFMLPDAIVMMLLGMGLFKAGVMSAARTTAFYQRLLVAGFATGLLFNGLEVYHAVSSGFDLLETFLYTRPTYQLGRLGMAAGYLALVMLVCQRGALPWLTAALADVGRMALTNYLVQSLVCLLIFSGAGLGLVGQLDRWMLYPIVLAIWVCQLFYSRWWLARYRFGPVEWLWRALTYLQRPAMKRA